MYFKLNIKTYISKWKYVIIFSFGLCSYVRNPIFMVLYSIDR
jgi:hypothetical protein